MMILQDGNLVSLERLGVGVGASELRRGNTKSQGEGDLPNLQHPLQQRLMQRSQSMSSIVGPHAELG